MEIKSLCITTALLLAIVSLNGSIIKNSTDYKLYVNFRVDGGSLHSRYFSPEQCFGSDGRKIEIIGVQSEERGGEDNEWPLVMYSKKFTVGKHDMACLGEKAATLCNHLSQKSCPHQVVCAKYGTCTKKKFPWVYHCCKKHKTEHKVHWYK